MNINLYYRNLYKWLLLKYMNVAYSLGTHMDKMRNKKLAKMLFEADIEMTPGMFLSVCFLSSGIVGISAYAFSYLAMTFIVQTGMAMPLSIIVGTVSFAAVATGFFFVLVNKNSTKKMEIERELPFALAYMSILSSAGSTPLKVIASLSIQNYGYLSAEFRKMGYRVYFLGEDAITAINTLANNTPSVNFRDTCIELGNIIHSGSGMMEYLGKRSNELIELRKIALKEFMEDLMMVSEIYLIITMFSILAIVGIPLIAVFGIQMGFFSASVLFMIYTFIILPFMNILFLALLEMKYSKLP